MPVPPAPTVVPRPRHDLESLLAAAVQVFTERGYDGTSMGDLARAAGLSKSSIYHHVESKEQLLRLALERAVEPLLAVTAEAEATSGRPIDRLEHVVGRVAEVLVEQLPYVTLLLRVRGNTDSERWALSQRRAFDRFVAGLVEQAARDGDVRDDVDPAVVTRLLLGMVNSVTEWYSPSSRRPRRTASVPRSTAQAPVTAEALIQAIVLLAFDGLRSRPG